MIVIYRFAAAVFFHAGVRALGDNVAEILDGRFVRLHICRNMGAVGNGAAADDGYLNVVFHFYDHSFPLRFKTPKGNETHEPLTQQVEIC